MVGLEPWEWPEEIHENDDIMLWTAVAVPVKVTIEKIQFENALHSAINIVSTTGAKIQKNRIVDGRSVSGGFFCSNYETCHGYGYGVWISPPRLLSEDEPELISGDVVIAKNFIDGMCRQVDADDPWGAEGYGGFPVRGLAFAGIMASEYAADLEIADNVLYNFCDSGIWTGGGFGTTLIHKNEIEIGPADDVIRYWPEGIVLQGDWAVASPPTSATYIFSKNVVDMGDTPDATGLVVNSPPGNAVEISKNDIHLDADGGRGIAYTGGDPEAKVEKNDIQGTGMYGMGLYSVPGFETDGLSVKKNKVGGFAAQVADYYLGEGVTNTTLYVRGDDTVLDESGNDTNTVIRRH